MLNLQGSLKYLHTQLTDVADVTDVVEFAAVPKVPAHILTDVTDVFSKVSVDLQFPNKDTETSN